VHYTTNCWFIFWIHCVGFDSFKRHLKTVLFEQHEVLWKIDREDYSDRVQRLKALNAIGKEMNVTEKEAKIDSFLHFILSSELCFICILFTFYYCKQLVSGHSLCKSVID